MPNKKRLLRKLLLFIGIPFVVVALLFCWVLFEFTKPTNVRDNADPKAQAEMLAITLRVADLQPIPPRAKNISEKTEGSSFTRSFIVEFTATPAEVKKWLAASKGIARSRVE